MAQDFVHMVRRWLSSIQWKNSRAKPNEMYRPTQVEHLANIFTHGLFILPMAMYSVHLSLTAKTEEQAWVAKINGICHTMLFLVSTVFHAYSFMGSNHRLKALLHRCDRAMIYLFIAGAYTPWLHLKTYTDGGWSYELRWAMWVFAMFGIVYQQLFHERYKTVETTFYVLIAVIPSLAVHEMLDTSGVFELKIGGIVYLTGVVFFKCDGRIPLAHAIWHLHVVAGAAIHLHAVAKHLYPQSNIYIS